MIRLSILVTFFFFLSIQLPYGQHIEKRDSLLTALSQAKEDSNKVNLLLLLGNQFETNTPDSSIFYYRQAGALAEKIEYAVGILKYISNISEELNTQSKYEEALALNLKSIVIAEKLKLPKRLAAAYSNTGVSYYYIADYKKCTDYLMKSISILERQPLTTISDRKDIAGLYANLTGILSELNQNDLAYEYGLKSLNMCRLLKDSSVMARTLNNLGYVLFNKNNLDSSVICLQQAKMIAAKTHNKTSEVSACLTLCNIYGKTGRYDLLYSNAEQGLILSQALEDSDGISKALTFKAFYYFHKKDYATAKTLAQQGLVIAKQNHLDNHIADQYLLLSDIELALGNTDSFDKLRNLSDSMHEVVLSNEILKSTQELEVKYSLGKKQMAIDSLAKEKLIQGLQLKQNRQVNLALLAAIIVLTFVGLLYYRFYLQKKKLMEADTLLKQKRIEELELEKLLLATQGILQGQEEERTRLSKDLHDGLGGILSSTKYSLSSMKENFIISPENANAFERTMNMLDQSITELRRVAHNMMPESLIKLSLNEALNDYCLQVTQSRVVAVSYQSYGMENLSLDNLTKISIYRIVQELINNVIKHASAKSASVQLIFNAGRINITVEDDGIGFDIAKLKTVSGIGYKSLQSRVDYLKGNIDVQAASGKGTSVYIEIPIVS